MMNYNHGILFIVTYHTFLSFSMEDSEIKLFIGALEKYHTEEIKIFKLALFDTSNST